MNRSPICSLTGFLRAALCLCPLLLAACGTDIKESLGLGKEAPDEFEVVSRPPLTVPPDFELRPPSSAADKPNSTVENDARKTLLGTSPALDTSSLNTLHAPNVDTAVRPVVVSNAPSGATASFLNKAGADQASPDIRQTLSQDAQQPTETKPAATLYDEVMGQEKNDSVVDPQKEAERIRTDQQEGQPVTTGDTPTVAPQDKSVLDHIF